MISTSTNKQLGNADHGDETATSDFVFSPLLDSDVDAMRLASADSDRVVGLTHRFYKYPARFSPKFVATAIDCFSEPGNLILDPYMGGGTTIVEALASGRQAAGCDLNSLAYFVTKSKIAGLPRSSVANVLHWATLVVPGLSYRDDSSEYDDYLCDSRTRNLSIPRAQPAKKLLAQRVNWGQTPFIS
ncbi:MAG: DNA methyltransferase [Betaproteobacteria bacterium]